MLAKRITTSVLLIAIIAAAIFIDWLFNITVLFFIVVGLYEFFTMLEKKGIQIYKYVGIGIGSIIPLSVLFRFEPTRKWEFLFILLTLLFLIVMQFKRRQNSGVIVDISTTLFGILYISWLFTFLIKIRQMEGGTGLLAMVLLITKLGDIGAFLVGMRFGRTPLIPRISPKKSVEGAIGGLLFSVLAAVACGPLLNFNYTYIILMGLSLGILGQLGDLSESLMKRDCQVKDSGMIFPGLGGVLDAIDSLLFSAPAFYFFLMVIQQ